MRTGVRDTVGRMSGSHSAGTYKTYRKVIDGLPESLRGEVIAGRLVVLPRPAPPHTQSATALVGELEPNFGRGHRGYGGWWIEGEPELSLGVDDDFDPVVPDLAGWRRERMARLPEGARFEVAPDWVCEVLSPSTAAHDRDEKMPFYARAGVSFAWIVDPTARTLESYSRVDGAWLLNGSYHGEGSARVAPFEEHDLDLRALWAR